MRERNFCHQIGCEAECCRNFVGDLPHDQESFLKAFPNSSKVSRIEELTEKVIDQKHGVYYYSDGVWIHFSVSGVCPNLSQSSNCLIHEADHFPAACRNMLPQSQSCFKSREAFAKNNQKFALSRTDADTSGASGR